MQPLQEQAHIVPEFLVTGRAGRTKHTIAVGVGMKEDLLKEEGSSLAYHVRGPAFRG